VALFKRSRQQANVLRYGSAETLRNRELLVLAAETALTNDHFALAREQTRDFFLLDPPRDQLFARTLFVVGACVAQVTTEKGYNGSQAVRQQLRAAEPILQALDIAQVRSIERAKARHE